MREVNNYLRGKFLLLLCSILLLPLALSQGVIKSNDTSLDAMKYDGNCMGCVSKGYRFCQDFQACLVFNGTCPRGVSYTLSENQQCPVSGACSGFGYRGIGYLGDDTMQANGGYVQTSGGLNITVPYNLPCYISFVNQYHQNLQLTVKGDSVQAYLMTIDLPYNTSNYKSVPIASAFQVQKKADMTYIFLGSVANQNTTAEIKWVNSHAVQLCLGLVSALLY